MSYEVWGDGPDDCESCDQLMTERDNAEEKADELAACIAALLGIDIGEHNSGNDPWRNAIEAADAALANRAASREGASHV